MRHRLAFEKLKRSARHDIKLDQAQLDRLMEQTKPFGDAIEHLESEKKRIRADSRLSNEGQNADIKKATDDAIKKIINCASQISRESIVADLRQRVATKVQGARQRAKAEMQDSAALATELRQHVLPKLMTDALGSKIPPAQVAAGLMRQAAEQYSISPAKSELIIQALSLGAPFCPDVSVETVEQINSTIAAQLAPVEQTALNEAEAVQGLIDFVTDEVLQSIKELP